MTKRQASAGERWTPGALRTLRARARSGLSAAQVGKELGRTASAILQKAGRAGISFRQSKRVGARIVARRKANKKK